MKTIKLVATTATALSLALSMQVSAAPNLSHFLPSTNVSVDADVNANSLSSKSTNTLTSSSSNSNSNKNANLSGSVSGSSSVSKGGTSSSNTGPSSASNSGNNTNVSVEGDKYDLPANSAAVSIGGVCVDSAAGQGMSFGISISRANPVCEKLKMHELYMQLGMKDEAASSLKDAEKLSDIRGFFRGVLTVITLGIL